MKRTMNGQQVVEFQDDTHATGVCYALAYLVNEVDGVDKITIHGIRYVDKYMKQDGRWLIAEREQYFVFFDTRVIGKSALL